MRISFLYQSWPGHDLYQVEQIPDRRSEPILHPSYTCTWSPFFATFRNTQRFENAYLIHSCSISILSMLALHKLSWFIVNTIVQKEQTFSTPRGSFPLQSEHSVRGIFTPESNTNHPHGLTRENLYWLWISRRHSLGPFNLGDLNTSSIFPHSINRASLHRGIYHVRRLVLTSCCDYQFM